MFFGMYFGTYWYVSTWHVLMYVLTMVRIACIGVYWYVGIDNGTYCMYWCVLVRMAYVSVCFISVGIGRY